MGLLLPHILRLRISSDLLSVSEPIERQRSGGGKRGDIKAFSSESRLRLFKLMHTLKFKRCTFITLTYPLDFPTDPKIYKSHLQKWRYEIEKRYGKFQTIWRLEFQKRGAPHYHLLCLDAPFVDVFDLSNLWADITESTSQIHRKIGVDVKLVASGNDARLIMAYLAKYVGKIDDRPNIELERGVGRWWGKWNIKEEPPIEIDLPINIGQVVIDRLLEIRKDKKWIPQDKKNCTILGESMGTDDYLKVVINTVNLVSQDRENYLTLLG